MKKSKIKFINKKHFDTEQHEKEVLRDSEVGALVSVPNLAEEMQIAKKAAGNFLKRGT